MPKITKPITLGTIAAHLAPFKGCNLHQIGRAIYKGTDCGAWIVAILPNGDEVYYEDEGADKIIGTTRIRALRVGSIVEGTDACCDPIEATTRKELDDALQAVEDQAREIWNDTHGCAVCDAHNNGRTRIKTYKAARKAGFSAGSAINPNCPNCKGDGAIL